MDTNKKTSLISAIITHLKFASKEQQKPFNEGDTFFSLCFKTDEELEFIAKLAGV